MSMKSIEAIERYRKGDLSVLKREKWLLFLGLTPEISVNLERVESLSELQSGYALRYTERTLRLLAEQPLREDLRLLAEEALCWSETAKAGMSHHRRRWRERGYPLFAHNLGSARIYEEESGEPDPVRRRIVRDLIATHGLIGQYIRGEVALRDSEPLYRLQSEGLLTASDLRELLTALNACIVAAVDPAIWEEIRGEAGEAVERLLSGRFDEEMELRDRLRRLRSASIRSGEDFEAAFAGLLSDERAAKGIAELLERSQLWYVEAALYDFSFGEFVKILLLVRTAAGERRPEHISFQRLMQDIYRQRDGKKRVNLYKKRVVEKYLSGLTTADILDGPPPCGPHVSPETELQGETAHFSFSFSPAGGRLIDFCEEAERSGVLYEKAVVLLFDLFDLRRDAYDRFYEEENYLRTMNQTVDYKSVLLPDIKGNRVIDIGPGGGALMDLIEERYPEKSVTGVDISRNVLDALQKRRQLEGKRWNVLYGDALNLHEYVEEGGADTVIFCSILHELYSYIEYEGSRFNRDTLAAALRSAFRVLSPGGRILIRDGVMTEPETQERIIRFPSGEGMEFLRRYSQDFRGREIRFQVVGQNEVRLPVNDAMEFLYTYTWGEQSYVHEVNEQFGYFTPSGYREFVTSVLGERAKILKLRHFLQEGYTLALEGKIELFDENRTPVRLPDSTCILVIEKIN